MWLICGDVPNITSEANYNSIPCFLASCIYFSRISEYFAVPKLIFNTQAELAEAAGVTTDHISHVESGSNGISLKLLLKIRQALRITPNDILTGEYETEEKSDGNTLSLDQIEPSDSDLIVTDCVFHEK